MTELETYLAIAGGIIAVLLFIGGIFRYWLPIERQAVRENQQKLRQQFREVLREIRDTCSAYRTHRDRSSATPRAFESARDKIKVIREDVLASPNEKHLLQLEHLLEDFAARYEAQSDVPALQNTNTTRIEERFDQIERRTGIYLKAIGRIERGRWSTYLRYKALGPPFIKWEAEEQTPRDTLLQRAARLLSRWWVVVLAVSIGGALLLFTYVLFTYVSPTPPIMDKLPADLRASCSADADTSATCTLTDGTVAFYHLFDTPTEARADVVNGSEPAPNGTPCPPSAPAAETSVVCHYAAGAETGVAAFSHTVKPPQRIYQVRWNPDANDRLRGVMTTANTTAQDWESLRSNFTRLAGMH